jgi:hypothetical protein
MALRFSAFRFPLSLDHFPFDPHGKSRVACDPFNIMFGTIRKHQSWLWFIIIGVMILGMIVWTNNSSNGRRATGNFGSIDNKAISPTEMQQAENDATLMYLVQTHPHQWPESGSQFDLTRQSYQRLYLQRRLDEYNIHGDPAAAARLANLILANWDEGQSISMDQFLQLLKTRGMTAEDFEHFLEGDIAIQQLETVVGLAGKVVTPDEIHSLYVEQYQELAVDAVFFSASNSLPKIPAPTPQALGNFYTNQMATYREPDKMQLSYVYYNVTNFMPQAEQLLGTNLDREVDNAMARVGTNISRLGKTTEEARTKVREILIQQVAGSNALVQAKSLYKEVVDKQTNYLENLNAVAKSKGLEVKVTKPFDKEYGPSEINLGGSYPVSSFFDLTPEDPMVPSPVAGVDGVYVMALNKFIPTHIPPLDEIKSRVEEDYKFSQALRIAQVNGQSFAQTVTNEMAHGKTFAQTCEATRITPVAVTPFSRATARISEVEDRADVNEFKNIAFGTPIGGVSRFIETPEGGFVLHVKQLLPVDDAKMKTQLPEFSNLVRERRQSEAFNIWFSQGWGRELGNGLRDIQALHKQQ